MRILFDYQIFEIQTHGGISRSFIELYKELDRTGVNCTIGVKESDNIYLKISRIIDDLLPLYYKHDKILGKQQLFRGHWKLAHLFFCLLGNRKDFKDTNELHSTRLLKEQSFDVFHPTYFSTYFLPYLKDKPFVLTIHDMIPELYPQYFSEKDFQLEGRKKLAPIAGAIIAVSENTKKDIIKLLHIPEEKIHVIYHGCSFVAPNRISRPFPFKYILYVGDRFGYKNFIPFIQHSVDFLNNNPEISVICTGKPFSNEEISLFRSLGIENKVRHQWIKNDDDLYNLYHFAEFFVYPSEYEGFGMPILEAFSADCPVLLNNSSCFPEIAGDAAEYFTFDTLSSQLKKMISISPQERESILIKQRNRLKLFSWRNSAQQLRMVYESILHNC